MDEKDLIVSIKNILEEFIDDHQKIQKFDKESLKKVSKAHVDRIEEVYYTLLKCTATSLGAVLPPYVYVMIENDESVSFKEMLNVLSILLEEFFMSSLEEGYKEYDG